MILTELGYLAILFALFGAFFGLLWLADLITKAQFDWFPISATVIMVSIAVYIALTQEIVYV